MFFPLWAHSSFELLKEAAQMLLFQPLTCNSLLELADLKEMELSAWALGKKKDQEGNTAE